MAITSSVCAVIVNYRTADLTVKAVRSLIEQKPMLRQLHVVIVDNASGDESPLKIRAALQSMCCAEYLTVLEMSRNGGFAFGNNAGIKEALRRTSTCDYVLFLNPDAVAHTGALDALIQFMDTHPEVGIAGSQIANERGELERSAHADPSVLGELEAGAKLGVLTRVLQFFQENSGVGNQPFKCDWVSGASMLVRRAVFEKIGLLDEGYFLYFEEADFCRRARRAGWEVWYVPSSRVTHLEGAATKIKELGQRRPHYWFESRRRYFVKHFGVLGLLGADVLWFAGRTSLALRRALRLGSGGNNEDPPLFGRDLLCGDLKAIFSGKLWQTRRTSP